MSTSTRSDRRPISLVQRKLRILGHDQSSAKMDGLIRDAGIESALSANFRLAGRSPVGPHLVPHRISGNSSNRRNRLSSIEWGLLARMARQVDGLMSLSRRQGTIRLDRGDGHGHRHQSKRGDRSCNFHPAPCSRPTHHPLLPGDLWNFKQKWAGRPAQIRFVLADRPRLLHQREWLRIG